MEIERVVIVAVEDRATAQAVARKAALVAIAEHLHKVVLFHAIDELVVPEFGFAMAGCWMPDAARFEEADQILDVADHTLRAAYEAHGCTVPAVERVVETGPIPEAIAHTAAIYHAVGVVLGARRPHRLGSLFHPDVAARIARQVHCPIYVAPLLR
jgi:nucleotide-binding universal stress UspA family protein